MSEPKPGARAAAGKGEEELEQELEITDEDEATFAEFGITDADQKAHAKILAASRVIAHRRLNKKPLESPEPVKPKWTPLTPKTKGG